MSAISNDIKRYCNSDWQRPLAPVHGTEGSGGCGRMKTESVYPEYWEERTRDEVLVLIDDYIHWHDHERIKQSLS